MVFFDSGRYITRVWNVLVSGSGSSYLYGFLDQAWKPEMTQKEAEVLSSSL